MCLFLGILNSKTLGKDTYYEVKWENYTEPTWEPKTNIPEFISNYYVRTGKNKTPNARIKHTKVVGKVDIYLYV